MFNTFKPLEQIFFIFIFFRIFFSLSNVHHSFSKLERILTLMIFIKNQIYNTFEYLWFKYVFGPKTYKFLGCAFNKSYSVLCG
jgi:hypothetical protein